MTGVVAGVEADVVGAEHPAQELGPGREEPVDLRRRETGCAGRSRSRDRAASARSASRHEREVEVVNPDPGPWRADGGDRLGEALVDLDVDVPRLAREVHAVDEVVEERPERLVADPPVERLLLGLGQEHRGAAVLDARAARPRPRPRAGRPPRASRPRPRPSGRALQRRHEPARARLEPKLVAVEGRA